MARTLVLQAHSLQVLEQRVPLASQQRSDRCWWHKAGPRRHTLAAGTREVWYTLPVRPSLSHGGIGAQDRLKASCLSSLQSWLSAVIWFNPRMRMVVWMTRTGTSNGAHSDARRLICHTVVLSLRPLPAHLQCVLVVPQSANSSACSDRADTVRLNQLLRYISITIDRPITHCDRSSELNLTGGGGGCLALGPLHCAQTCQSGALREKRALVSQQSPSTQCSPAHTFLSHSNGWHICLAANVVRV